MRKVENEITESFRIKSVGKFCNKKAVVPNFSNIKISADNMR